MSSNILVILVALSVFRSVCSQSSSNCCPGLRIITESGTATVKTQQTSALLTISLSETHSSTATDATAAIAAKLNRIYQILETQGVDDSDIKVSVLSLNGQTGYQSPTGLSYVAASVTVQVTIRNPGPGGQNLGEIFDTLVVIPGISIYNSGLQSSSDSAAADLALTQAFNQAKQKASILAGLSGSMIVGVTNINANDYEFLGDERADVTVGFLIK